MKPNIVKEHHTAHIDAVKIIHQGDKTNYKRTTLSHLSRHTQIPACRGGFLKAFCLLRVSLFHSVGAKTVKDPLCFKPGPWNFLKTFDSLI